MLMPTSDMTSGSCLFGSDLENYGSVSPERASAMQVDEQFSPSLLKDREPNGKVSAGVDTFDSQVANPVSIPTLPIIPNDQPRGRSLTHKSSQAERRRAKSTVSQPRGSRGSQPRSQSRVCKIRTDVIQPSKFVSKDNAGAHKSPPVATDDGSPDDELTQMPQPEQNQT